MSQVSIQLPQRSTKAYTVSIGTNDYFFSYRTCVGFRGYSKDESGEITHYRIRRQNEWGPTTGRHINSDLNIKDFEIVETETFQRIVESSVHSVKG